MHNRLFVTLVLFLGGCSPTSTSPYYDGDGGSSSSGGGMFGVAAPSEAGTDAAPPPISIPTPQPSPPPSGTPAPTDPSACGLRSSGKPACDQCLVTSCCDVARACTSDHDCVGIFQCASQCARGDQTCVNGCESQYPNGLSKAESFAKCIEQTCGTPCAS